MTQTEFLLRQRKFLQEILTKNEPLKLAASTAHKDVTQRIFEKGQNSNGGNIGQYDTKTPLYVNPNTNAGSAKKLGKPAGKHGDTVFKSGKPHKTVYVQNYKDYRNRIGRRIDKVNLVLSGDLQSDFTNGRKNNPIPKKITQHEYAVTLSRAKNADKVDGIERKYGEIFSHTKDEIAKFVKIADLEFKNALSRAGL